MENSKWKFLAAACALLTVCYYAPAQKRIDNTPPPKPPPYKAGKTTRAAGPSYFLRVTLDERGNTEIGVQKKDGPIIAANDLKAVLADLALIRSTKPTAAAGVSNVPGLIVKPAPGVTYGQLMKFVGDGGNLSDTYVILGSDAYSQLEVQKAPAPGRPPRPNPLFLLVEKRDDGELYLNNEPQGPASDTSGLENFLQGIIKERTDNGVFREGENTVEATVNVAMPDNTTMAELEKIVGGIRAGGSDRVKLGGAAPFMITTIQETPRVTRP